MKRCWYRRAMLGRVVAVVSALLIVMGGPTAVVAQPPLTPPGADAFGPIPAFPDTPDHRFFATTGHSLNSGFKVYWEAHGGLVIFGYPISEEFQEREADGQVRTAQYFERARFEYHPEFKGSPYEVELGLLGQEVTASRAGETPFQPIAAFADSMDHRYFAATGHSLNFGFKAYWEANGGLAQFGYPISEEFTERNPDMEQEYTVQYFERERFEYHPEFAGTPYEVELGRLGAQVALTRGYPVNGQATPTPGDPLSARFAALSNSNERLRGLLGPPATMSFQSPGAVLEFEHGRLIAHREDGGLNLISVLCGDPQTGQAFVSSRLTLYYEDTFSAGQPVGGGPGPQPGLYEPGRVFGALWRARADVRNCLGYATVPDAMSYTVTVQNFSHGLLLSTSDGQAVYALYLIEGPPPSGRYERFALPTP